MKALRARPLLVASIVATLLVVLRSVPHVFFAASHFDSDMAMFGIMGLDIVRGESLPFYTYGQQYLLALEAYFAAPFLAVTGASVVALKLPLVALNAVTAVVLVRNMRAGLITTRTAFVSALPFIVPSVYLAKMLVAAHGCNIEPFVAVVLLFTLRDRPIAFGLIAGVFYLNREFTAYALPALVVADVVERRRFERRHVFRRFGSIFVMALVVVAGRLVGPHGPHYFGAPAVKIGPEREPLKALAWFVSDILPVVTGAADGPAPELAPHSLGQRIAGALLVATTLASIGFALSNLRGGRWRDLETRQGLVFPAYLFTVALVASGAVVFLGGVHKDVWAARYDYLALFGVCAMLGAFFATERSERRQTAFAAVVTAGGAISLLLHVVTIGAMASRPEQKERVLARWLVEHGHETGRSEYWTAYSTSFLSGERTMLTSTGGRVPIQRYEDRYRAAVRKVEITAGPCHPEAAGETVLGWCVSPASSLR